MNLAIDAIVDPPTVKVRMRTTADVDRYLSRPISTSEDVKPEYGSVSSSESTTCYDTPDVDFAKQSAVHIA